MKRIVDNSKGPNIERKCALNVDEYAHDYKVAIYFMLNNVAESRYVLYVHSNDVDAQCRKISSGSQVLNFGRLQHNSLALITEINHKMA